MKPSQPDLLDESSITLILYYTCNSPFDPFALLDLFDAKWESIEPQWPAHPGISALTFSILPSLAPLLFSLIPFDARIPLSILPENHPQAGNARSWDDLTRFDPAVGF